MVAATPTQWSSKEGVSLAVFLMNSRALVMVSSVAEEVLTPLTSLSTFCMKNLLHSAAHSASDLQLYSSGNFSVLPRLSIESASLHAAACRLEASAIFFTAVCTLVSQGDILDVGFCTITWRVLEGWAARSSGGQKHVQKFGLECSPKHALTTLKS